MQPQARVTRSLRDRMLGRALVRAVAHGLDERPELAEPPDGHWEVKRVGLDPLRVLVIGAGLAVEWGAVPRSRGFTTCLADVMQERTGRGVVVHNRARGSASLERTVEDLGLVGASSFSTVVWCPSLFDVVRSPAGGRYRHTLLRGLALLRETAEQGADIAVCELPTATRRAPVEEVTRLLVPRINLGLRRTVDPLPGVRTVPTPSFSSLADPGALSPAWFRSWAEQVLAGPRAAAA